MANKAIALNTWAGVRYYEVEVVDETPHKVRVKVLTPGGLMLPGRRYFKFHDTVLVPKHSLFDMPESYKIEEGYYDGYIYGYGGPLDAKK